MANFLNPIEILNLGTVPLADIDATTLKKAKRQLFADIDLSDDGHYDYHGTAVTKTDCEAAIDQLEDDSRIAYYHYLAGRSDMNKFLATGDEQWFGQFTQDDMFGDPGFRAWVSPFLAERLDRSILRAFQDNNEAQIKALLKAMPLVNGPDTDRAFRSLSHALQVKIDDVDRTKTRVANEEIAFSESEQAAIGTTIVTAFPVEALNALPAYFQSQINRIASSVNFLQVAYYERFDNPEVPFVLLDHILKLRLEGADRPTFQSNFEIISKRQKQWLLEKLHAGALAPWQEILQTLRKYIKLVEAKIETPASLLEQVRTKAPIAELNGLPAYADGVRTQIASAIRGLAIASWNTNDDIRTALAFIRLASQLIVPHEVKEGFKKDLEELQALAKKYEGIVTCYFCSKRAPEEGAGYKTTIYKETSREWFPQRRVQFQYIEVTLPRCKTCKDIHEKGKEFMLYLAVGCTVIGALIGAVLPREPYIIGAIIGLGVGLIAGLVQKHFRQENHQILGTGNGNIRKHPMLEDRFRDGWTLTKPSA